MLTQTQIAFNGAMALLMGLLVGIERGHSHKDIPWFAGIRQPVGGRALATRAAAVK